MSPRDVAEVLGLVARHEKLAKSPFSNARELSKVEGRIGLIFAYHTLSTSIWPILSAQMSPSTVTP